MPVEEVIGGECNKICSGRAVLSFQFSSKSINTESLGSMGATPESCLFLPLHLEGPLSPQHPGHQSGRSPRACPLAGSYQDSPELKSLVKSEQVRQQEHEGDEEGGQ